MTDQAPSLQENENPSPASTSVDGSASNSSPKDTPTPLPGDKFSPTDHTLSPSPSTSPLPPELWTLIHSTPASFSPDHFLSVSRNLLENPNLTASHLSRAELSYTSFTDPSFNPSATHPPDLAQIVKHLRPEYHPRLVPAEDVPGFRMQWCVVRKLVPRNPKLDESLVQSCYLYTSNLRIRDPEDEEKSVPAERYLIIYVPHTDTPDDIPFYHPKCARLAILYTYLPSLSSSPSTSKLAPGTLSHSNTHFPTHPLDTRLIRTSLNLLLITHKHARGRAAGYKKRVHHDVVVPQKQFQDTYVYLKGKYARTLMEGWVESTPAGKHVFEDLGIAAFLIELWVGMYGGSAGRQEIERGVSRLGLEDEDAEREEGERRKERLDTARAKFPGFVDIGCGNGLLVHILNQEGWRGWGFDARTRKSWATFTPEVQANLKEMLLVPEVLQNDDPAASVGGEQEPGTGNSEREPKTHNGVFPTGTFIISNHADELTLWTPLLASLSSSPFIAIPCCSHDFGGSRFRAPFKQPPRAADDAQGKKGKQPSAYASLCSYLEQISRKAGYVPEKEHLRIPSTRNVALLGRSLSAPSLDTDSNSKEKENEEDEFQKRMQKAREIVVEEMPHCDIEQVRLRWLRQGGSLQKEGKGGGH